MQDLFPDSFLSSIGGMRVDVRHAPPRAAHGAHLSSRDGASLEFRDYQGYAPGDDLRRVDWNVYARTRHLFVRRFERPTAVPVFQLIDASDSMHLETPSRYATAARVAAAIGAAALASGNPVGITVADGAGAAPPRAVTGRRGLVRLLADLAADRTPGGSGAAAGLEALMPILTTRRRGVVVVISDFFEPRGVEALLDVLRAVPHRLALVRVTQPTDAEPTLAGDLELVDCESSSALRVSTDAAVLRGYREAYARYFAALDEYVALRGAAWATIDASQPTLPQLERLFPDGVMTL
jgi:uncharacterized protein (DUF58 family)